MRTIMCDGCKDKIEATIPFFELEPKGMTFFLEPDEIGPWHFCSYDCLNKWSDDRMRQNEAQEVAG